MSTSVDYYCCFHVFGIQYFQDNLIYFLSYINKKGNPICCQKITSYSIMKLYVLEFRGKSRPPFLASRSGPLQHVLLHLCRLMFRNWFHMKQITFLPHLRAHRDGHTGGRVVISRGLILMAIRNCIHLTNHLDNHRTIAASF